MPEDHTLKTKSLDFHLADFSALKAEIGRRSNLQRVVLGAYVAMIAWVFQQAASHELSLFSLVGLWLAAALILLFHRRDSFEIRRLGRIVRERIAPQAAKMMNVSTDEILPSQTNSSFPEINKRIRRYHDVFEWAIFFGIPASLSTLKFFQSLDRLDRLCEFSTPIPWYSLISAIAAIGTLHLLWNHPRKLLSPRYKTQQGQNLAD